MRFVFAEHPMDAKLIDAARRTFPPRDHPRQGLPSGLGAAAESSERVIGRARETGYTWTPARATIACLCSRWVLCSRLVTTIEPPWVRRWVAWQRRWRVQRGPRRRCVRGRVPSFAGHRRDGGELEAARGKRDACGLEARARLGDVDLVPAMSCGFAASAGSKEASSWFTASKAASGSRASRDRSGAPARLSSPGGGESGCRDRAPVGAFDQARDVGEDERVLADTRHPRFGTSVVNG